MGESWLRAVEEVMRSELSKGGVMIDVSKHFLPKIPKRKESLPDDLGVLLGFSSRALADKQGSGISGRGCG